MAIRIQLRRDTSANWVDSNPVLRVGEIGIETDTLQMKLGDGTSTWTQITAYMNLVPDGNSTIGDYVLVNDIGAANGVVGLNNDKNAVIPASSIILEGATDNSFETTLTVVDPTEDRTITFPNATGTVALEENVAALSGAIFTGNISVPTSITFEGATADSYETTVQVTDPTADRTITFPDAGGTVALTTNIPSTTDNLSEGSTNKYYTDERAQDAIATAIAAGTHTNITITYDDDNNKFTFVGANTYSDENAQDAVGNSVGNGLDYNDETGAISVDPSEFALSAVGAPTANVSMATYKVTGLGAPTESADAATKQYVDNTASGVIAKPQVLGATTINIDATYNNGTAGVGATLTHNTNGVFPAEAGGASGWAVGKGILVKNQTNKEENGRYYVSDMGSVSTPYVLTRCSYCDEASEIPGAYIFVQDGTLAGTGWIQVVADPATFTVGTDDIDVYQFSGSGTYTAGTGLTLTGNEYSINTSVTADLSTAQTLTNKTLTSPNINEAVALTATATELNVLDGITSTTAELNILDGVTSTAAELNILDGVTSTAAELNILDGVTSTAAELNILNGATLSTTELNYVDGVTSAIQTQLDGKVDESLFDTKGDILVASADNTPAKLAAGTNGYLLTANSAATNGVEWAAAPVSLPSQSGESGKYLTTDGTTASWGTLVVPITTGTATVSANTATTVDTTALSAFTSIEYMVSLKQDSKIRTSKVVVQTDGTSVDMTEFAITETGGTIAGVVVSATTSSTNAVLQLTATDAVSTNVTVKFSKIAL
jgi:hypothetical protein